MMLQLSPSENKKSVILNAFIAAVHTHTEEESSKVSDESKELSTRRQLFKIGETDSMREEFDKTFVLAANTKKGDSPHPKSRVWD